MKALICAVSLTVASFVGVGCRSNEAPETSVSTPQGSPPEPVTESPSGAEDQAISAELEASRDRLLALLEGQGITSVEVLQAIREVPRHRLVPEALMPMAYADRPLPIGEGQTISQPYIVALMTELAEIDANDKVLEVGTGSGYQAAVLGKLAGEVFTIEIVEPLAKRARADLERLGLADDIHFRTGDGYAGWPEEAPFDAIVVTAAPPKIPAPLKEQLKIGGRLVIPVGETFQELRVLEKTETGLEEKAVIPVRFVPMTGKAQEG